MSAPRLSIVLAVHGRTSRPAAVLAALAAQWQDGIELLVCHPEGQSGVGEPAASVPGARSVAGARDALVPHLWRDGILAARAPRVALGVVHCRPAPGWVEACLGADLEAYAGIGGAIDNHPGSDALGWAVYLLRYGRYGRPFVRRETADLPGDNVVYDRDALLAEREAWSGGFWEPAVHARLVAAGRRLCLDPALLAIHSNGYRGGEIARQRLAHGRRFGHDRARTMAPVRRLLYALATPVVPLVLGAKVARQALARPATRRHLARAFPWLATLTLAWGFGEWRGAVDAVLGREPEAHR